MTKNLPTHLIRNCEFKYACHKTWASLQKIPGINEELIRYCDDCQQEVHLIQSEKSLLLHIEFNHCVAIPFEMTNRYRGLKTVGQPTVGMIKLSDQKGSFMYWYLGGLATLFGAYVVFRQSLGVGDNTSTLLGLRALGKLSTVICFVLGFFVYPWWVPFVGIFCAMPLWFVIQVIALKMTFSMLIALRSQLGMIIGTVMSVYGLINPQKTDATSTKSHLTEPALTTVSKTQSTHPVVLCASQKDTDLPNYQTVFHQVKIYGIDAVLAVTVDIQIQRRSK